MGVGEFLGDGPGPDGGQSGVDIEDGLLGEDAGGAGSNTWQGDGGVGEVGQEGADVASGDSGQG